MVFNSVVFLFCFLPLSLLLFYLLLPQRAQETFSTLCGQVITMRRLPPACALLIFACR